ncbi:MAG: hypothetical protein KatS3mg035_1561 [Bacteroidia bacterium]|nr:MAG: hypothetical protein KatS3mg035_1561 [Bacteroidia bacterium]
MVKVFPVKSSGAKPLPLALLTYSFTSLAIWVKPFKSAFLITGTTNPSSIATATPILI